MDLQLYGFALLLFLSLVNIQIRYTTKNKSRGGCDFPGFR